ncbi:PREDICTED: putative nuclease HARBI1 isoform X2 [Gavialis gangeticus]|uniref:putative nuclease HARBI1 isoform X2 n=1 Tax=Gavialis gangeticus TaxID=94835 RepID=UPI00092F6385|nr:PREDICTED: putative nuclease HARBI1 isoform X2 [Gavialis gangeticus]
MLLHPMVLAIRRRRAAQGEPRTQALALGPARSLPQPRSQSHPHAQTLGPFHQQLQARTQGPAHPQLQARTQGPARPQPQTQAQGLGPARTQPLAQALGPAHPQATAQALVLGPARPQPRARARARQQAQARVYQPHQTFEGLSDRVCIQRYRLTADAMYHLCDLLRGSLGASQNTNFALSVPDKVSTALAILASGSFQRFAAQTTGVGQSTASRVLGQFLEALIPHTPDYITFPTDPSTQGQTMRDFLEIANIPQVLGAVDGTYVNIKKPAQDSHTFVNRHRTYAMNMMVVSSARLEFTDVLARFPGSSHDSSVWSQSALLRRFRRGEFTPGWLLGDHSYPLQPWLLTPLAHPEGDAELQYNHAHKRTRFLCKILQQRYPAITLWGCESPMEFMTLPLFLDWKASSGKWANGDGKRI